MTEWNPLYAAYAKAHGRSCEDQLVHDREAWPGGRMAGYMLWIREAWHRFSEETGETPAWGGAWSTSQLETFREWLT